MNTELNIFVFFSKHLYDPKYLNQQRDINELYIFKPLFKHETFKLHVEKASRCYQIFFSKRIGLLFFHQYVPEFCMYFYKRNVYIIYNKYFVLLLSNYSPS